MGKRMKFTSDDKKAVESEVMKIYRESSPKIENLFEWAYINHLAWSLVVLFLGLIFWLSLALVNAENQRHALMTLL